VLAPFGLEEVARLLADALHQQHQRVQPLVALVLERTGGNPFFVSQFISELADEGLLAFDPCAAVWSWDAGRIDAKGYTGNVVDLMVGKLDRLPADTRDALEQLAGLGDGAPTAMLTSVLGSSEERVHENLWEAVRAGLLVRRNGTYAFLHDRVQEAAYAGIPEGERAAAHLRLGRILTARTPPEKHEEAIFDLVNQLNRGTALITSKEEREQVAALNLVAAERATQATAYESALAYLVVADGLLADDRWQACPGLAFAVELARARCEFLTGEPLAAEARLAALAGRTPNVVQRAALTCVRLAVHTGLDQYDRAVEVGLEYLGQLGTTISPHPTDADVRRQREEMWRRIGDRPIEALIALPAMTDPGSRATMDVLASMLSPSLFSDRNLNALLLFWMANLSVEHGNCDALCLGYAQLMTALGPRFDDYSSGARFGQLGFDLMESRGLTGFRARVQLVFGYHVVLWVRHLRLARSLVRQAFETAHATGDLTFAAYASVLSVATRADGEYRWSMTRAMPLRDDDGNIVRWYGSTIDIEQRKRNEETIRQQEQELRLLVDLVPHHILVVDAEWRLLRANRSGLDYLGLTSEELARNESFAYYHPGDLEKLRKTIASLARGVPEDFEGRARRHDGQYRWHLFRYVPLRDEHGRVTRWYITGTDIEDRKRAEERVREENLALREEVDKASMFEEIVGTSDRLRRVLAAVSRVAPTDATVLITGETGTGKELIARAIHRRSRRSSGAFVSVNCGRFRRH
jgi:PAS domain S-box-containing protein